MKPRMQIRESLFYGLGILLILGFVFLYSSRFLFTNAMPPVMVNLFFGKGQVWAIAANAAVFILFLAFLPYRRGIASYLEYYRVTPMCFPVPFGHKQNAHHKDSGLFNRMKHR